MIPADLGVTAALQAGGGTRALGFTTRVAWTDDPGQGLRDGVALYRAAEELGYQAGWAYQRHFDHYLSSPLPFFAAVGQHTSRIRLGSAVIPMRYQDPILLAEAAGTTDLLVGGRLDLALATGSTALWDRCSARRRPIRGRRRSAGWRGSWRPSAGSPCTRWTDRARAHLSGPRCG
ncbi:LLM class flavin-dependent oxidoreductase [Pseudonocardia xishanensis]|uniref:Luciferase-like domain-containing protein n=1 Tax=Pseudonocardia xishanensis TaxID=630995 RepID=A0ABP8RSR8_9PSEU